MSAPTIDQALTMSASDLAALSADDLASLIEGMVALLHKERALRPKVAAALALRQRVGRLV